MTLRSGLKGNRGDFAGKEVTSGRQRECRSASVQGKDRAIEDLGQEPVPERGEGHCCSLGGIVSLKVLSGSQMGTRMEMGSPHFQEQDPRVVCQELRRPSSPGVGHGTEGDQSGPTLLSE